MARGNDINLQLCVRFFGHWHRRAVSVATRTLTFGAKSIERRQMRPIRRSKLQPELQAPARARTDACRLDGRPCTELASGPRGSESEPAGGTPHVTGSHRVMKAGNGGPLCPWKMIGWSGELPLVPPWWFRASS